MSKLNELFSFFYYNSQPAKGLKGMIDNGKETAINLNPKYKARAAYCVRVLLFNTTVDCVRVLLINLTVD